MKLPSSPIVESLVPEYSHQSVQIENNRLSLGVSVGIADYLGDSYFKEVDLASTSASELSQATLPDVHGLYPDADASQVAELRNHIVACQWIVQNAVRKVGTTGLTEDELRHLSAVLLKGTKSSSLHSWMGKESRSGRISTIPYWHPRQPATDLPLPPRGFSVDATLLPVAGR